MYKGIFKMAHHMSYIINYKLVDSLINNGLTHASLLASETLNGALSKFKTHSSKVLSMQHVLPLYRLYVRRAFITTKPNM